MTNKNNSRDSSNEESHKPVRWGEGSTVDALAGRLGRWALRQAFDGSVQQVGILVANQPWLPDVLAHCEGNIARLTMMVALCAGPALWSRWRHRGDRQARQ